MASRRSTAAGRSKSISSVSTVARGVASSRSRPKTRSSSDTSVPFSRRAASTSARSLSRVASTSE
eukprot:3584196-Prymnesium_polylepis.1